MKIKLFVLLMAILGWSCKQQPEKTVPKQVEAKQETAEIKEFPKAIKELARFAELTFTDTTDFNNFFRFIEIDTNKIITDIDMNRAVDLYERLTGRGQPTSFPIFEIKNTDTAILPIQGVGFVGAIWAKVLVDKNTLEIKKIAFEHKGETEGYGAAMTQSSFEDQFTGTKIDLDADTFVLQRAMERIQDDGQTIEGISGATMTSQGVVDMVNQGMKRYRNYLTP